MSISAAINLLGAFYGAGLPPVKADATAAFVLYFKAALLGDADGQVILV